MTRYIIRLHEGVDIEAFAAEVPNVERVLPRVRMVVAEMGAAQAEALGADPRVEFVEEDQTGEGAGSGSQVITSEWHLDRIDQRALPLDGKYEWDHDGTGVRIYILDTGIRGTHEAFAGRLGPGWSAFAAPNDDPYEDPDGHGTAVAGAAAGLTTGPARGAEICSVRFASHSGVGGSQTADVVAGVNWILDQEDVRGGPAVVNFSYSHESSTVAAAFQDLINAGILICTSAMNSGNVVSPTGAVAAIPEVMYISSTESDDSFGPHNHGARVDLLAPGISILTAQYTADDAYGTWDGTSFASPMVAGVAAMLLEQNPDLHPVHLRALLISQATPGQITNLPPNTTDRLLYARVDAAAEQPPAIGPVLVKVGTFTKRSGTGTQSVSWPEGGQWGAEDAVPKALLVWYTGANTDPVEDDTTYSHNRMGIGVATADTQYALVTTQRNASGSQSAARSIRTDRLIHVQDTSSPSVTSGTLARASLVSFDANGFTIDWDINANTYPYTINYLALGGDGIEDVGLTHWPLGGEGVQGLTDLGFSDPANTPDCVLAFHTGGLALVYSGDSNLVSDSALGMGVMTRGGGQWAWGITGVAGSTSNSRSVQRTDSAIVAGNTAEPDAIGYRASLHTIIPNGALLDVHKNTVSGPRIVSLAIRGGVWAAGSLDQPASTGAQAVTDLGFDPVGLIFGSFMRPANTDGVNDARFMLGATDGATARALAAIRPNGLTSSAIISVNRSTANPVLISTANDLTPNGIAALDSLDEGGFTLDWTTTDSTDAEILYLAFAGVTLEPPPVPQNLVATAVSHDSILLTWEPGVPE